MSSIHSDKGWLFISFMLNGRRVRLYPGLRFTRTSQRSPLVKKIKSAIAMADWAWLAHRFPAHPEFASWKVAPSPTLKTVAAAFLVQQEAANAPGTADYYKSIVKGHIEPSEAGSKPIRSVTANDISLLVGKITQRGNRARAGKVRRALSAIFLFALRDHLVDENPVVRTKPVSAPVRDPNPFTPAEQRKIIEAARGWERHLVTVAMGTGMRPAEIFGLKRENIDLAELTIGVRQNLTRRGEGALKTARSHRTIDLSRPAWTALTAQLKAVELKGDWVWPDLYHTRYNNGPRADLKPKRAHVLGTATGNAQPRPHSGHNFSRRNWPAILRRAKVEHREFLQCRHTYALTMLRGGADWDYIAEQMGTSIAMLHKHYLRLMPGKSRKPAKDLIDEALKAV